jgi:hypothetical protein
MRLCRLGDWWRLGAASYCEQGAIIFRQWRFAVCFQSLAVVTFRDLLFPAIAPIVAVLIAQCRCNPGE